MRHGIRRSLVGGGLAVAALFGSAREAAAQFPNVPGGDFDIGDFLGTLQGNTARLRGRAGFGTDNGRFVLVNAILATQDVDQDGFTGLPNALVGFTTLRVRTVDNFTNIADPARTPIDRSNFKLINNLNPLPPGANNAVEFLVDIPDGTAAGIYRGNVEIDDPARPPSIPAEGSGEALRVDNFVIEIEVLARSGISLVRPDTAARLDSLVLRGRPGQTVSGPVRLANAGNVGLDNARLESTDLVSTSGTGLRIRREQITFGPALTNAVALGDTARITVFVRIPIGILAGSYQGELIAQADGVADIRVPFTVIVTTPGDIVFENNPVFGRQGDNAVIIFNADPGTTWKLRIFDMMALTVLADQNTVFATDQAVRYTWALANGRGEQVAAGMYYVIVEAVQNGRRRQIRGKLMVIR